MAWRSPSISRATDADNPVGFRAKRHSGLVDVDKKAGLEASDFWEPIWQRGSLVLDPDQFYILASKEAVRVPPTHAAEMVPFNPLVGEFRVHYAGFLRSGLRPSAPATAKARAPFSKCARMRCRSSWKTGRSSAGWSMSR